MPRSFSIPDCSRLELVASAVGNGPPGVLRRIEPNLVAALGVSVKHTTESEESAREVVVVQTYTITSAGAFGPTSSYAVAWIVALPVRLAGLHEL